MRKDGYFIKKLYSDQFYDTGFSDFRKHFTTRCVIFDETEAHTIMNRIVGEEPLIVMKISVSPFHDFSDMSTDLRTEKFESIVNGLSEQEICYFVNNYRYYNLNLLIELTFKKNYTDLFKCLITLVDKQILLNASIESVNNSFSQDKVKIEMYNIIRTQFLSNSTLIDIEYKNFDSKNIKILNDSFKLVDTETSNKNNKMTQNEVNKFFMDYLNEK